jgi:hypothetical protein
MTEHDEQEATEQGELDDLEVPADDADDVRGGRAPGPDPIPIPYPNQR